MTELIHFIKKVDLKDYVLILPSVCVGNVPQLTIDLLITTHDFKKLGTVWHPAIIASVGGDPFASDPSEICTACELYVSEELRIAAVQLRSSIERNLATNFFGELKKAIVELKFKSVLILTSSFAHELHDVNSGHFRYITTSESDRVKMDALKILPMESTDSGRYVIFGSGFAIKLYETLSDSIDCTVLIKYSSEGDNRPDAVQMLNVLYKISHNFNNTTATTEMKFPASWEYVFGNPTPVGMFY